MTSNAASLSARAHFAAVTQRQRFVMRDLKARLLPWWRQSCLSSVWDCLTTLLHKQFLPPSGRQPTKRRRQSTQLKSSILRRNPRRHIIVVVRDVVLCDVVCGGVPHTVVAQDITQRLIKIFRCVWAPDIVR